jgi:hypothetical protein
MVQAVTRADVEKIADRALEAVKEVAEKPSNTLSPTAVHESERSLEAAIERKVATTVAHLTNNEPWYQSRVTIGSYLAIFMSILGLFGVVVDEETQRTWTELIFLGAPMVIAAAGGLFSLYGRWRAKNPLFAD